MKQNFLYGARATLQLTEIPDLLYYFQDYPIPEVSLHNLEQGNQFVVLNVPGTHLRFQPLVATYLLSENLQEWHELFKWMNRLAPPEDRDIYTDFQSSFCDGTMTIYTNQQNPVGRFKFYDMYPMNLSPIFFTAMEDVSIPRTNTVTFSYRNYDYFPV